MIFRKGETGQNPASWLGCFLLGIVITTFRLCLWCIFWSLCPDWWKRWCFSLPECLFPHRLFHVLLPNLLTPLPVPVSTANLNCNMQAGRRNPQTSRWDMWKIFGNICGPLCPQSSLLSAECCPQTFAPHRKDASSFYRFVCSAGIAKESGQVGGEKSGDTLSEQLMRFLASL